MQQCLLITGTGSFNSEGRDLAIRHRYWYDGGASLKSAGGLVESSACASFGASVAVSVMLLSLVTDASVLIHVSSGCFW